MAQNLWEAQEKQWQPAHCLSRKKNNCYWIGERSLQRAFLLQDARYRATLCILFVLSIMVILSAIIIFSQNMWKKIKFT
ncbi:hypothetical protein ACQP3C_27985, partial [Escherichia coli]